MQPNKKTTMQPKKTNRCDDAGLDMYELRPLEDVAVMCLRRPKPAWVADSDQAMVINVTSTSAARYNGAAFKDLSPFFLGPCELYPGAAMSSATMENAWQYAKVYPEDTVEVAGGGRLATNEYWAWARDGWASPKANRFPKGRGRRPLYSLWDGERLDYIAARKKIYAPLYARAAAATEAYAALREVYRVCTSTNRRLVLVDHDGYDYIGFGMTLRDVINADAPKMGHAFVLAGMLQNDEFWMG